MVRNQTSPELETAPLTSVDQVEGHIIQLADDLHIGAGTRLVAGAYHNKVLASHIDREFRNVWDMPTACLALACDRLATLASTANGRKRRTGPGKLSSLLSRPFETFYVSNRLHPEHQGPPRLDAPFCCVWRPNASFRSRPASPP